MPRVVEKRSVERQLTGSKVIEVSIGFVLMAVLSIVVGFVVVILSLRTNAIVKENDWLRAKIDEMGYILESVESVNLERLSNYETLILDGGE